MTGEGNTIQDPEQVLKEFLEAWGKMEWEKMIDLSQISWIHIQPNPLLAMKAKFSIKPIDYEIRKGRQLNPVVYAAIVKIIYAPARGTISQKDIAVRVIRESVPMIPDENGTWGVCPMNFLF